MTTRQAAITALAIAGIAAGVAVQRLLPGAPLALPWYAHLLLVAALAIAVPLLLGSVGSSGAYRSMARLWSAIGALGILLLGAGVSAAVLSLAQAGSGQPGWLLIAVGAGLLAGLGAVKLALRQAAASHRA